MGFWVGGLGGVWESERAWGGEWEEEEIEEEEEQNQV